MGSGCYRTETANREKRSEIALAGLRRAATLNQEWLSPVLPIRRKAGRRMTLLTRKVDYAILVLSYLHHHPEGGCAPEIADGYSLSRAFVANILKELCHKGFVTSHRGVKGGYVQIGRASCRERGERSGGGG